jgi:hypothetical protein
MAAKRYYAGALAIGILLSGGILVAQSIGTLSKAEKLTDAEKAELQQKRAIVEKA